MLTSSSPVQATKTSAPVDAGARPARRVLVPLPSDELDVERLEAVGDLAARDR